MSDNQSIQQVIQTSAARQKAWKPRRSKRKITEPSTWDWPSFSECRGDEGWSTHVQSVLLTLEMKKKSRWYKTNQKIITENKLENTDWTCNLHRRRVIARRLGFWPRSARAKLNLLVLDTSESLREMKRYNKPFFVTQKNQRQGFAQLTIKTRRRPFVQSYDKQLPLVTMTWRNCVKNYRCSVDLKNLDRKWSRWIRTLFSRVGTNYFFNKTQRLFLKKTLKKQRNSFLKIKNKTPDFLHDALKISPLCIHIEENASQ